MVCEVFEIESALTSSQSKIKQTHGGQEGERSKQKKSFVQETKVTDLFIKTKEENFHSKFQCHTSKVPIFT